MNVDGSSVAGTIATSVKIDDTTATSVSPIRGGPSTSKATGAEPTGNAASRRSPSGGWKGYAYVAGLLMLFVFTGGR